MPHLRHIIVVIASLAALAAFAPAAQAADTTPPTGLAISTAKVSGGVEITFDKGTDEIGGSGIDTWVLKRTIASHDGTSCGTFDTNYGAVASNPATSPFVDTTVASGNCYRYRVEVTDVAGNTATLDDVSTHTYAFVYVDSTPPSFTPFSVLPAANAGAQHWDGSTAWFNPATTGAFAVRTSAGDAQSGISDIVLGSLGYGLSAVSSSRTGGSFEGIVSWAAGAPAQAIPVIATNSAGSSSTASVDIAPDAAPPTGATITAPTRQTTGRVPLVISMGTDTQSGVRGWSLQRSSAVVHASGCGDFDSFVTIEEGVENASLDAGVGLGTCHLWRLIVRDNVGNIETTEPVRTIVQPIIKGGRKNDTLIGGRAAELLGGGAGNDTIRGNGGDDVLGGGSGNDRLFGGPGNDRIIGGSGNDFMAGQQGVDRLEGGPGDDVLNGGTGPDTLLAGPGRDTIIGASGNDLIGALDGERDIIRCGPGARDRVIADRFDYVARDCEFVQRRVMKQRTRRHATRH
ncbi:MAG: hypothetical protein KDC46_00665 [Thermoleophilia bacterium]|nr:hypothetical protein [Thermoleophilia bacterium]